MRYVLSFLLGVFFIALIGLFGVGFFAQEEESQKEVDRDLSSSFSHAENEYELRSDLIFERKRMVKMLYEEICEDRGFKEIPEELEKLLKQCEEPISSDDLGLR